MSPGSFSPSRTYGPLPLHDSSRHSVQSSVLGYRTWCPNWTMLSIPPTPGCVRKTERGGRGARPELEPSANPACKTTPEARRFIFGKGEDCRCNACGVSQEDVIHNKMRRGRYGEQATALSVAMVSDLVALPRLLSESGGPDKPPRVYVDSILLDCCPELLVRLVTAIVRRRWPRDGCC